MDAMVQITFKLSESLLSIFRDSQTPFNETFNVCVIPGKSVSEILIDQGINPLLVPMVARQCGKQNIRLDKDTAITEDTVLILHGPLAGG